jgi:hypothetical protein
MLDPLKLKFRAYALPPLYIEFGSGGSCLTGVLLPGQSLSFYSKQGRTLSCYLRNNVAAPLPDFVRLVRR